MPQEPLLLGIDGGQTATKALVARLDGRIVGIGRGGPSDHFHAAGGEARNRSAIHGATLSALDAAGATTNDIISVVLGLTGAPTAPQAPRLAEAIVREIATPRTVAVVADYVTNLAGASCGQPGVVVIAGGGSIAYGTDASGREAVAGGFGYLLGDEGSAYDIGRQAMVAAARASDGRGNTTNLEAWLVTALGLGSTREITRVVYAAGFTRDRISELAPLVAEVAEAGDLVARGILERAGRELGLAALAVVRRLFDPGAAPVVFPTGGVFAAGEPVLGPFRTTLHGGSPESTLGVPAFPPVVGSLLLAARLAGVEPSSKWFTAIRQSLPQ